MKLTDAQKAKRMERLLNSPPKRLQRKEVLKRAIRAVRPKLLDQRYAEQNRSCFYCRKGIARDAFTLDHMLPLSKGGDNSDANLVGACQPCNERKSDMTAEEFLDLLRKEKEERAAAYKAAAEAKRQSPPESPPERA